MWWVTHSILGLVSPLICFAQCLLLSFSWCCLCHGWQPSQKADISYFSENLDLTQIIYLSLEIAPYSWTQQSWNNKFSRFVKVEIVFILGKVWFQLEILTNLQNKHLKNCKCFPVDNLLGGQSLNDRESRSWLKQTHCQKLTMTSSQQMSLLMLRVVAFEMAKNDIMIV